MGVGRHATQEAHPDRKRPTCLAGSWKGVRHLTGCRMALGVDLRSNNVSMGEQGFARARRPPAHTRGAGP